MPNLSDVNFTKHVPTVIYFDMSVTSEVREKVRRRRVTRQTQRCEGSKRMYKNAVERGIGLLSSECTWGTNHFLGQLQSFCDKGGSAMNLRMFNTLLAPLCPICPYFHHVYCISRIYRPRSAYARLSAKNDVRNIACQIQRRTSIHRKFKYTCLETFFLLVTSSVRGRNLCASALYQIFSIRCYLCQYALCAVDGVNLRRSYDCDCTGLINKQE